MDLSMRPNRYQPLSERLWSRVERKGWTACWPWTGATRLAYGRLMYGGRATAAHRVVWELVYGPIPVGLCVLHSCDNPPCCNPNHLFLGTIGDNNRDRHVKGRDATGLRNGAHTKPGTRARGSRNGRALYPDRYPRGNRHWTRLRPGAMSGERNPRARLSAEDVGRIRLGVTHGVPHHELAFLFGVARSTISRAARGDTWKALVVIDAPSGVEDVPT